MADINPTIRYDSDFSKVTADIKRLVREATQANAVFAQLNKSASAAKMQAAQTFASQAGFAGFKAQIVDLTGATEQFGQQLMKNKLTMKEYFREAASAYKKDSKARALAEREVRRAQSTVVGIGDVNGQRKGMLVTPQSLNMKDKNVQLQIANKQYEIFNDLVQKGSTAMVNWGKNTQWAGRQLTVGLTVPMGIFTAQALKAFAGLDAEVTRFRKVYGSDLKGTVGSATDDMVNQIKALGSEFAKQYGIASKETMALAADLAAAGLEGQKLANAVNQTTRMMVLGEVDRQQAMTATLSIQTAFNQSSRDLAKSIDFLNAVENSTSASLQDLTEAIPKTGPVIQALGGDIKDLSILMTAMREGGINAAEGANALKSGMASLISPTSKAIEVASQFGIDLQGIVNKNKGELMPLLLGFQDALRGLDEFGKAKLIEEIFGKYQFARISALFDNLNAQGSQTVGMVKLLKASSDELAKKSYSELKAQENAPSTRLAAMQQQLQEQLIKVGADLAETLLPIMQKGLDILSAIVDGFNNLPGPIKSFAKILGGITVAAGPVLMLAGIFGNLIGNAIKFGMSIVNMFKKMTGHPVKTLQILSDQELAAKIAADQLSGAYDRQRTSVMELNAALDIYIANLREAAAIAPPGAVRPGGRGPRGPVPPIRRAEGGVIYAQNGVDSGGKINGYGGGDTVPALLEPGEFVINKQSSAKYAPLLRDINQGKDIPGFSNGWTPDYKDTSGRNMSRRPAYAKGLSENVIQKLGISNAGSLGIFSSYAGNPSAENAIKEIRKVLMLKDSQISEWKALTTIPKSGISGSLGGLVDDINNIIKMQQWMASTEAIGAKSALEIAGSHMTGGGTLRSVQAGGSTDTRVSKNWNLTTRYEPQLANQQIQKFGEAYVNGAKVTGPSAYQAIVEKLGTSTNTQILANKESLARLLTGSGSATSYADTVLMSELYSELNNDKNLASKFLSDMKGYPKTLDAGRTYYAEMAKLGPAEYQKMVKSQWVMSQLGTQANVSSALFGTGLDDVMKTYFGSGDSRDLHAKLSQIYDETIGKAVQRETALLEARARAKGVTLDEYIKSQSLDEALRSRKRIDRSIFNLSSRVNPNIISEEELRKLGTRTKQTTKNSYVTSKDGKRIKLIGEPYVQDPNTKAMYIQTEAGLVPLDSRLEPIFDDKGLVNLEKGNVRVQPVPEKRFSYIEQRLGKEAKGRISSAYEVMMKNGHRAIRIPTPRGYVIQYLKKGGEVQKFSLGGIVAQRVREQKLLKEAADMYQKGFRFERLSQEQQAVLLKNSSSLSKNTTIHGGMFVPKNFNNLKPGDTVDLSSFIKGPRSMTKDIGTARDFTNMKQIGRSQRYTSVDAKILERYGIDPSKVGVSDGYGIRIARTEQDEQIILRAKRLQQLERARGALSKRRQLEKELETLKKSRYPSQEETLFGPTEAKQFEINNRNREIQEFERKIRAEYASYGAARENLANLRTTTNLYKDFEGWTVSFIDAKGKIKTINISEIMGGASGVNYQKGMGVMDERDLLSYGFGKSKVVSNDAANKHITFKGYKNGGVIFGHGMNSGGQLNGYGGGDKVPAMLEPGEFVINKESSQKYGTLLRDINMDNLPGFSGGGTIEERVDKNGRKYYHDTATGKRASRSAFDAQNKPSKAGSLNKRLGGGMSMMMNMMFLPMMLPMMNEMEGFTGALMKAVIAIQVFTMALQAGSMIRGGGVGLMAKRTGMGLKGGVGNMLKGQGAMNAFKTQGLAAGLTAAAGPLLLVAAGVAAVAGGIYLWRQRVDELAGRIQNMYGEATEMAKVYNIEIKKTGQAMAWNQRQAKSLGMTMIKMGKGQVDKDYEAAVKKDFGGFIDRIKEESSVALRENELRGVFSKLILQGFSKEQAQETTAEIARQSGSMEEYARISKTLADDLGTLDGALNGMVNTYAMQVQSLGTMEEKVQAFSGALENLIRVAADTPAAASAAVGNLVDVLFVKEGAQGIRESLQDAVGKLGFGEGSWLWDKIANMDFNKKAARQWATTIMRAISSGLISEEDLQLPEAELRVKVNYVTAMEDAKVELNKVMDERIKAAEEAMEKTNEYYDNLIEKEQDAIDEIQKNHDKKMEQLDDEANKLNDLKDILSENADYYIRMLQKQYDAERYYQGKREAAVSGLKSLAEGDIYGFLDAQMRSASDAQQFGREQAIKAVEDARDAALNDLDFQLEINQKERDGLDDATDKAIDKKNDAIEGLQMLRSTAIKGLRDYIDLLNKIKETDVGDITAKQLKRVEKMGENILTTLPENVKKGFAKGADQVLENLGEGLKNAINILVESGDLTEAEAAQLLLKGIHWFDTGNLPAPENPRQAERQDAIRTGDLTPAGQEIKQGADAVDSSKAPKKGIYDDILMGAPEKDYFIIVGDGFGGLPDTWKLIDAKTGTEVKSWELDGTNDSDVGYYYAGKFYDTGTVKTKGGRSYSTNNASSNAVRFANRILLYDNMARINEEKFNKINAQKKNKGGMIYLNDGSNRTVPGMGNTDTVPAMLTPGEFVMNKAATEANLPLLQAMNGGAVPGYNSGGMIRRYGSGTMKPVGNFISPNISSPKYAMPTSNTVASVSNANVRSDNTVNNVTIPINLQFSSVNATMEQMEYYVNSSLTKSINRAINRVMG